MPKIDKDKKKRETRAAELRADIAGLGVRNADRSPREMTDAAARQAWADAKTAKRGKTAKRTR